MDGIEPFCVFVAFVFFIKNEEIDMKVYLYCVVLFIIIAFFALLYFFIKRMRKHPHSSKLENSPNTKEGVNTDSQKQEDSKTVSAGEYYATLAAENHRKLIQKRLRQKQFLKRHPETEQMIHSLKCINGSIQGVNNAVRKLSDNLRDLQKTITELSDLAE